VTDVLEGKIAGDAKGLFEHFRGCVRENPKRAEEATGLPAETVLAVLSGGVLVSDVLAEQRAAWVAASRPTCVSCMHLRCEPHSPNASAVRLECWRGYWKLPTSPDRADLCRVLTKAAACEGFSPVSLDPA
jgi:hypothetical protein